jgi:hypothetical protein
MNQERTIETDVSARLDRLPWSAWRHRIGSGQYTVHSK